MNKKMEDNKFDWHRISDIYRKAWFEALEDIKERDQEIKRLCQEIQRLRRRLTGHD